jgi:hypothetical protein
VSRATAPVREGADGWQRFWFEERSTAALAVQRIVFGCVVFVWTLTFAGDVGDFLGPDALVKPGADAGPWTWTLFDVSHSSAMAWAIFAGLLLASAALIVGWHTRIAALLVFVGVVSIEYRNTFVGNSGDALIRILALTMVLAPAGAALSLDRWRKHRDHFWEHPARSLWVVRFLQIQFTVLYISSVWAKVRGTTWNDGTAVSIAQRITDLERFPLPGFLSSSLTWANLLTYSTLAIELGLGVLVWNRRLRPWVLFVGAGFHLTLGYNLRLGFFVPALLTLYLAFLSPAAAAKGIDMVRRGWADGRKRADAQAAGADA